MNEKPWVKTYCGGKPNYTTPEETPDVDAVNMTQECVDETAKSEHKPLYMDMSQVPTGMPDWKPGMVFPAPKREWVGLTDEEIIECFDSVALRQVEDDLVINKHVNIFTAIRGIEAKLKEKNVPQS